MQRTNQMLVKQRELKQRLVDKKYHLVSHSWIMNGNEVESTHIRRTQNPKRMMEKVVKMQNAAYLGKVVKRNRRGLKEGNNAVVFVNKKRGHAMKVFGVGSAGDYYVKGRTFQRTLQSCLVQIKGKPISQIDSEIRKLKERLERIKKGKIDPRIFNPTPYELIKDLVKEKSEILRMQKERLKDTFWRSKPLKKGYLPFVYSIRIPKIFEEHRLPNGEYAISMEYIKGPTLNELLEGLERKNESEAGRKASLFLKQNQLKKEEVRTKIVEINKAILDSVSPYFQNPQTPFVPRMDSFIVEGIDKHKNLKLVLVDNA